VLDDGSMPSRRCSVVAPRLPRTSVPPISGMAHPL
jgi:hypothetical protein